MNWNSSWNSNFRRCSPLRAQETEQEREVYLISSAFTPCGIESSASARSSAFLRGPHFSTTTGFVFTWTSPAPSAGVGPDSGITDIRRHRTLTDPSEPDRIARSLQGGTRCRQANRTRELWSLRIRFLTESADEAAVGPRAADRAFLSDSMDSRDPPGAAAA